MKILAVKCPKIVTQSCNKRCHCLVTWKKQYVFTFKKRQLKKKSLIVTVNKLMLNMEQF